MTRPNAEQVCVNAQFHGDEPRRAADGAYLCPGCVGWLRRAVAELPSLHADLEAALHGSRTSSGGLVSGTPDDPLPGNLAAQSCRIGIVHVLASACQRVAEQRGLDGPFGSLPRRREHPKAFARVSVGSAPQSWDDLGCGTLADWLLGHVEWVAAQDFALEIYAEVKRVRGWANATLDPSRRRSIPLRRPDAASDDPDPWIPCATVGPDLRCTGRLVASIADTDSLLPSEITCDVTCPRPCCEGTVGCAGAPEPHTFPPSQWLALGRRLHAVHEERSA